MKKQHELSHADRKLLVEIEKIVADKEKENRENDSLYGFCAHLSSTKPYASYEFQESLENKLMAKLQNSQIVTKENKTPKGVEGNTAVLKNSFGNGSSIQRAKQGIRRFCQHYFKEVFSMRTLTSTKRMSRAIPVMLVIMFTMVVSLPSLRAQISDAIKSIFIGSHTVVEQIHPQMATSPSEPAQQDAGWILRTEIGNFGGDIFSTPDIEKAQLVSSFQIRIPGTLPEGYTLREVKAIIGQVFLFYEGPRHDIIISQTNVVENALGTQIIMNGVITDGVVEKVEIQGQSAAWVENGLVWEKDGISYHLGGLDLDQDEAIAIARSFR